MSNDKWETPPDLFDLYADRYPFVADLACDESNKRCAVGFTEQMNSLRIPWALSLAQLGGWGWLNPPYSNPLPWVVKSVEEQKRGASLVMLLNVDTSVMWFRQALASVSEIHFFIANDKDSRQRLSGYRNGRVAFINPETGAVGAGNNKPQFALVFDAERVGARITKYYELEGSLNEKTFKTGY